MAYERLNLCNGDVLAEEHLAHIEDGVVALNEQLENEADSIAKAAAEKAAEEAARAADEQIAQRVEEIGTIAQSAGHSPTAVMSQRAVTREIERIDGIAKMYASDFVSGYLVIGTGLGASGTWIINPEGAPVKKGDKIRINPNGLVVKFMGESVPDLPSIVTHVYKPVDISVETEIVADFDGYAFFQIRDAAWGVMSPDLYVCDISIGDTNADKIAADIKAIGSKCVAASPKHKPMTRIINDCQTASDWTINNTASIAAVDTTNYIHGAQSLRSNNYMRCIKKTYDMVNNDIVVKFKINSIASNARLYLKAANTADANTAACYQLAKGGTWTTPSDWHEIAIPYTAWSYRMGTGELDFTNINDVWLFSAEGAVDWNVQYIGLRPKPLKKAIVTFTFDDGYKSQYTGIKTLAEKGVTGTIFHIKESTETNPNNYLSVAELQELVNYYGADIEVHGDPSYDQWNESDLVAHWESSQEWLKDNGLGEGKYMAYPNGIYPERVVQLAKRYFNSCRTITSFPPLETYPPADRYRVRAVSGVGAYGETAAAVKQHIDNAVAAGAWLVLVFHRIGEGTGNAMDCSVADLQTIADYAIASGAYVMNYAEVFESGIIAL